MTSLGLLFRNSTRYFAGQALVMIAGFVSFPIFTRIFAVDEYGILILLTTTLLVVNSLGKFGFQASIVQFYAEFKKRRASESFLYTMLTSSAAIGLTLGLLFGLGGNWGRKFGLEDRIANLAPFLGVMVLTNCLIDILTSFLRAEQRTGLYSAVAVIRRYGSVGLSSLLALYLIGGLRGFYVGQGLWGLITLGLLLWIFWKKIRSGWKKYSLRIAQDSAKFGLPLVWAELGHLALNYADRYLIQFYLGSMFLGFYAAGYNLATYLSEAIMYPLNYALTPIYTRILLVQGEGETKKFLGQSLRYFLFLMIGVVFGFIGVGRDLLTLLATEKFQKAFEVIPWVIAGQAIYACSIILNNGLFIKRKTYILTLIMVLSCGVNLGLNLMLIPRHGIIGAAMATLISNTFYTIIVTYFSFKEFAFPINYQAIFLYLLVGSAMYWVIGLIDCASLPGRIVAQIGLGAVFYLGMIGLFDRDVRRLLRRSLQFMKAHQAR